MQPQKKHFPIVGLVTLVVIAAAGGSSYYYQYYTPHTTGCGTSVHRVFFMTAIVQEQGGFNITREAIWNQRSAALPTATNSTAPLNFTGVQLTDLTVTNPKTISANIGDTITIYMASVNGTIPPQYSPNPPASGLGHGFGIDNYQIPSPILLASYGARGSTTFTFQGGGTFRCLHQCSPNHGIMTGSLSVGASCG